MRTVAGVVGFTVLIPVIILLYLLQVVYLIDLVLGGWLLALIFIGPIFLSVISLAGMSAIVPVTMATKENATSSEAIVGTLMIPIGLAGAFMLWQLQNWIIYGIIDVEPELYNSVFKLAGLEI